MSLRTARIATRRTGDVMPTINGWVKGMDNIHADNEISLDTLRRAINVDIMDSGKIRRRRGHALALAVTNGHSLWSNAAGQAYFVEGNQLKKLNANVTATLIGAINTGLLPLSYQEVDENVYISSPLARGRLHNDVLHLWGIALPTQPPTLAETAGILDAGTYHAVVTYLTADGRESGPSAETSITLDQPGGITTTALPVPDEAHVTAKRLYLTSANGDVFYKAAEVAPNAQFVTIGTPVIGQELRTKGKMPPPYAIALAFAGGRVFMVDATDPRIVWFTDSMSFDLVDRRKNYYQFPKPVTMIAGTATGMGLYVSSDRIYFIANPGVDGQDMQNRAAFAFPAIARTLAIIQNTLEPIWLTERGACIGKEQGAVQVLAADRVAPGKMMNAASMVRESDSLRQFIAVGDKTEGSALEAGSYAEAEITRRKA
jgi:hypothetical protein